MRAERARGMVAQFCFPDFDEEKGSPNDHLTESFTFTLTQGEGTRLFGFCRRLVQASELPICLCVLSRRPWFSLFMHMLDILQLNYDLGRFVPAFVTCAYDAPVPPAGIGTPLRIEPKVRGESYFGSFRLTPPTEDRPTGVHFEGLISSLGVPNTLRVLGALMTEQRVVFVGSRWGHVSGCAHAATVMLYPLEWQHILIPVLPKSKLSYACAPMPFVLGVQTRHLAALQKEPLEQLLFVDVDKGQLWGDAEVLEAAQLPSPHREHLQSTLVGVIKAAKGGRVDNGAVADALLGFMVRLLGGYRSFVRPAGSGGAASNGHAIHPDFDEEAFLCDAPVAAQPFLQTLRGSQLFEVWLRHHLEMDAPARELSAFERAVRATPPEEFGAQAAWASEPLPVEKSKGVRAGAATLRHALKDSDARDKLRASVANAGAAALSGLRRGARSVKERASERTSSSREKGVAIEPSPSSERASPSSMAANGFESAPSSAGSSPPTSAGSGGAPKPIPQSSPPVAMADLAEEALVPAAPSESDEMDRALRESEAQAKLEASRRAEMADAASREQEELELALALSSSMAQDTHTPSPTPPATSQTNGAEDPVDLLSPAEPIIAFTPAAAAKPPALDKQDTAARLDNALDALLGGSLASVPNVASGAMTGGGAEPGSPVLMPPTPFAVPAGKGATAANGHAAAATTGGDNLARSLEALLLDSVAGISTTPASTSTPTAASADLAVLLE